MDSKYLAFLAVVSLLIITPGADMAIVTKVVLSHGRRGALFTTLGINAGAFTWTFASALGLVALLTASWTAFTIVQLAGACYLIYLGVQALWSNRSRAAEVETLSADEAEAQGRREGSPFRQGLFTNLFNPKIGVFYTTFIPQFISRGQSVFLSFVILGGIHNLLGFLWFTGYARAVTKIGNRLRRPRTAQALGVATGAVLLGLGVSLLLERLV